MSFIEDGTGAARLAKVDRGNRLHTKSIAESEQHAVSRDDALAFQTSTNLAITASEQNLLLVQNGNATKNIIVTYIRIGTVAASAASASAFFKIMLGGSYSSGGTTVVPANMNIGSANTATGIFKDGNGSAIVTTDTFVEIDRFYDANTLQTYRKEGSLIIPNGQAILISYTGADTDGRAYARISFFYDLTI